MKNKIQRIVLFIESPWETDYYSNEMKTDKKDEFDKWFANFNAEACVDYNNKEYRLTLEELKSMYSSLNYWHSKTDPGSWLSESLVRLAKRKYKGILPRKVVISLCAGLLNITPEKLESNLDWNANYMAWHDGGTPEQEHVWAEKELPE
ncbi:MAG: hypothetical protein JW904_10055 [Spirochaetales bacterium]|nr:hypothetical protein [Spirochaetales bacterium]